MKMIHCHCSRYRKSTGTGHATNMAGDPANFRWLGGRASIRRHDLPTARSFSTWFCNECGSPLPRTTRDGKVMANPAGSLDGELPVAPSNHIFWGSRATWGCVSGDLPTHEQYPAGW